MFPHHSKAKDTRSKYDQLFPEIEEVLGPAPTFRPCTIVWRDVTVHTKLKDGKLKRLANNGKFFLIFTISRVLCVVELLVSEKV